MSSIINNGKHYLNKINNIIKESSVQSYNIESANDKVKHKIRGNNIILYKRMTIYF